MTDQIAITEEEKRFLYEVRSQCIGDSEPSRDDVKRALQIISRGLDARAVSARMRATKATAAKESKPKVSLDDLFGD